MPRNTKTTLAMLSSGDETVVVLSSIFSNYSIIKMYFITKIIFKQKHILSNIY